ncbi:cilia- and flagella-associated protein 69-like isoform X2 [Girardinichthys multiradiatus]|uniref:cilia- and flagella-associated protein 69-like isoform X2 n=1 Tax=Girardinichthys multiradiatus TaxID=208333 RepID=UPI001FAD8CA0|nr:cilia- and flagella-associated protein 69-like isoform X2 [Girardinichthys multiradiatus]
MDSGKLDRTKPEIPVSPKSLLDLSKVIRLLEDPLTERHLFVLKKLLKRNHSGFLLSELADISQILNICAEKVSDQPKYASVLCEALEICSSICFLLRFPFLKERTSDELIYAQDATEFLSNMGHLMRVPHAEVQEHVVELVRSFFSSDAPTDLPEELQATSAVYRLQLLERSDLPKTLLLSMAALQNQPSIKLQLLQTLQLLSSASDMNCTLILDAGGAEMICLHMNDGDLSGQVLLCSSEILWNLLESRSKEEAMTQLSSMECVVSLKEAFSFVLEITSCGSDLQLRNYLLVITTLIAENPNCPLIESLFAKQLLGFITFPELNSSSVQKLTYSREDLKMRKLLLNLLFVMCRNVAALQLFREELVMVNLLQLVNPPVAYPEHRPASPHCFITQQEELQLQALDGLASIAPVMLHDYMSCQGNTCLLLLLERCTNKDAKVSRMAQMQRCIRVLRSVTALGDPAVNQDLCDQGAINQLLGFLILMEGSYDEDDVIAVEMMSNIQLILSELCETDLHRKELFGLEGVKMVVRFLKKGPKKFYSGLGHNKLVISTVDCVWSCIVGCCITEYQFLAKEGASLLLDLLQASPRCIHSFILATLLDLCNNPNTRPQILSWRDVSGQTAPRVLLQLWREEEEELGVLRNQHGGIKDPEKPLLTGFQEDSSGFPADTPSAALLAMSENLRAKIYLLFCSLGFQELPGLSAGDYVTLGIVRRYLDFKVGEVWNEICSELILDGVKPIRSDQEALRSICKTSEETARRLMEDQTRILEEQEEEEIREEMLIYKEMKSRQKQQEIEAKSWDRYISRTSNYNILKEEKAQRKNYMESNLKHENAAADRPAKLFISHILAVENTGDQGPAGVDVTLARTSV